MIMSLIGDLDVWIACFFFVKQKTAYEMRISDWSSDVCSSDLAALTRCLRVAEQQVRRAVGRNHLHIEGNIQLAETIACMSHRVPVRTRAHDHANQDRKSTRLNSSH